MKVRAGQSKLKLPPVGRILSATALFNRVGEERLIELAEIELEKMAALVEQNGAKHSGFPMFYTHDGRDLQLYPVPHVPVVVKVRFYPPEEVV